MPPHPSLRTALGAQLYDIAAPWGDVPGDCGKITDVAVLPDGWVIVLTRRDSRVDPVADPVHLLSPEGRHLGSFGGARLVDAHKVAVDRAGLIWVVDRDAHEIVAFDRAGTERRSLGQRHAPGRPFNHPADIAFLGDGRIVVADGYAAGRIHLFNAAGAPAGGFGSIGRAPGQFIVPHALAVTSDDRIVVADRENDRIQIFAASGALLSVQDIFMRPQDVWVAPDDTILVSDSIPTLTRVTAGGEILGRARATLNGPHGLCGAPDGSLYLAETNPHRMTRIRPLADPPR